MMEDGRLVYANTVNGKKLYTLDREKLGMVEPVTAPIHGDSKYGSREHVRWILDTSK
jgi:hypothetical protein